MTLVPSEMDKGAPEVEESSSSSSKVPILILLPQPSNTPASSYEVGVM